MSTCHRVKTCCNVGQILWYIFIKMATCRHGFCKYISFIVRVIPDAFRQGIVFIGLRICFRFHQCLHTCQTPSQHGHQQILRRRPQRSRRQRLALQMAIPVCRPYYEANWISLLHEKCLPKRAKCQLLAPCANVPEFKQRSMHYSHKRANSLLNFRSFCLRQYVYTRLPLSQHDIHSHFENFL